MSSSFFSALTRAKENTKHMVENASAHLSAKLQMNVNSSPPMPHKYPSISSPKGHENRPIQSEKLKPDVKTFDLSNENGVHANGNTIVNNSIKYSEPISLPITSQVTNVTSSDVNEFLISKSTEFIPKEIHTPNLDGCLIENKVSAACNNLSVGKEIDFTSKIDVPSVNSNCDISKPYICHSNKCNLPSCNLDISAPLEVDSAKNPTENLDLSNDQNFNSCPTHEVPFSVVKSVSNVNTTMNVLQESAKTSVTHPELPINNTESLNSNSQSQTYKFLVCNPKRFCIFCETKEHNSHNCFKMESNSEFWNVIYSQKRCKNCLRQFHFSNNCYDSSFCLFNNCRRRDKHSPILCKFRYKLNNFASHQLPDTYQDIFQGSALINKKFFSQATQTNPVQSKDMLTQTLNFESTDCKTKFISKKSIFKSSNSLNLLPNSQSILTSATSPVSTVVFSSNSTVPNFNPVTVSTTLTPVMSTATDSLICNVNSGSSFATSSFMTDPDEISRRFIAEMIPKLRKLPKGEWCENPYL